MAFKNLNIVFEDNDILVCVKPAGIATESANIRNADMVSMVKSHLLASSTNGSLSINNSNNKSMGGAPYVGLIHRLDQPVSGILVFAKNPAVAASLSKQVQTEDMQKHYTAVVEGNFQDTISSAPGVECLSDGTILVTNYLLKDSKQNKAIIAKKDQKGLDGKPAKDAKLIIENISFLEDLNVSILRIKLLTGRFHQIRAQLSNLGHPIVGDAKYGSAVTLPDMDTMNLPDYIKDNKPGIALCASELSFIHPRTHQYLSYKL